jgi:pimeloyl-ACP methyl ester carboxylesterase
VRVRSKVDHVMLVALASALLAVLASALLVAAAAPGADAMRIKRIWLPGFHAPKTPEPFITPKGSRLAHELRLDRVGLIEVGPANAKNVLVLEPGTSAAAAYFVPFAKSLVEHVHGWQVWAVERRENLLEDQSELNAAKLGETTAAQVFHYYLGWLLEGGKPHFDPLPETQEIDEFADEWGMDVAVEDLHSVIDAAKALGGKVVLGGHSLGGSVVTAYATWDFGGTPGADGLSGLVYDDGGSSPVPVSQATAEEELGKLHSKSPWLAFGGIPAPFLGIFSALGSTATLTFPEEASIAESSPLLPSDLKPRNEKGELIPVTNEAEFGFGVNVGSSPPALIAAQVHAGAGIEEAAKEDGLHGWNGSGALTPLRRYAEMLSGTGLSNANGSEWYFPERLTIDTGAVAEGNANPAQQVLGEHAIHGHELPTSLKILAINSELDQAVGANSLEAAKILAEQSGIPAENLTLIDREQTYAHNDPAGADPAGEGIEGNIFFQELAKFLKAIA